MAKSLDEIAQLLKYTRFKGRMFGVDEADVWNKLTRLQQEYASLFAFEQAHNERLVSEWQAYAASLEEQIKRKDEQLKALQAWAELHRIQIAGSGLGREAGETHD